MWSQDFLKSCLFEVNMSQGGVRHVFLGAVVSTLFRQTDVLLSV